MPGRILCWWCDDAVGARAVIAFHALDHESEFLAECAADESSDAVCLPPGRGHELRKCCAVLALQECKHRVLLRDRQFSKRRSFFSRSLCVAFNSGFCALAGLLR